MFLSLHHIILPTHGPSRKNRKKKKKDGFNSTFGKIRAIDPLAEENKKHLENMEKGFLELLDLHNTMELSSLCGMIGLKIERKTKNVEKKELISGYIRDLCEKVRGRESKRERA